MRIMVLSLKYKDNKPEPYYGLTAQLIPDFNCHNSRTITVNLPSGVSILKKGEWLNKNKIYQCPQDAKLFFVICTKHADHDTAFKTLLNHALKTVDGVIERGLVIKQNILKQLAA